MKIINGNVIRALYRIKKNPNDAAHLVEEEYLDDVVKLLQAEEQNNDSQFTLEEEFALQYRLVKNYITSMGEIQTPEDLSVVKEAHKFLQFILKNEERLNDIKAVKAFKEAVLEVLDEEDPELRDRVIRKLSNG